MNKIATLATITPATPPATKPNSAIATQAPSTREAATTTIPLYSSLPLFLPTFYLSFSPTFYSTFYHKSQGTVCQYSTRYASRKYAVRLYAMNYVTLFRYVCDFLRIYTKTTRVPDVTLYAKSRGTVV